MFHYAVDAQVLIQQESLDLAHYLHVEMPLLRRIAHRPLVHDDAQELVSMFEKLANACTLPNDRAEVPLYQQLDCFSRQFSRRVRTL